MYHHNSRGRSRSRSPAGGRRAGPQQHHSASHSIGVGAASSSHLNNNKQPYYGRGGHGVGGGRWQEYPHQQQQRQQLQPQPQPQLQAPPVLMASTSASASASASSMYSQPPAQQLEQGDEALRDVSGPLWDHLSMSEWGILGGGGGLLRRLELSSSSSAAAGSTVAATGGPKDGGGASGGMIQMTRIVERPGMRVMQVPSAMAPVRTLPWRQTTSCTAPCCRGRAVGGCDARRLLAALRREEVFVAGVEPIGAGAARLDQWCVGVCVCVWGGSWSLVEFRMWTWLDVAQRKTNK